MSLWRKQFPFIWIKNVWDWNDLLDASIALWPQFPSRRRLLRQRQASGRWPTTRTTLPAVSRASICSQTSRPFWRLPPTHPPLRCLAASHPTSCARGARMEGMLAAKHYLLLLHDSPLNIPLVMMERSGMLPVTQPTLCPPVIFSSDRQTFCLFVLMVTS